MKHCVNVNQTVKIKVKYKILQNLFMKLRVADMLNTKGFHCQDWFLSYGLWMQILPLGYWRAHIANPWNTEDIMHYCAWSTGSFLSTLNVLLSAPDAACFFFFFLTKMPHTEGGEIRASAKEKKERGESLSACCARWETSVLLAAKWKLCLYATVSAWPAFPKMVA